MARENEAEEPDSKTRLRLWLKMLRYTRRAEAELRDKLRTEFDTTLPRFDVLAALYKYRDGLKMSELSGVLLVSNGNATVVVDRLVKDGLVERNPVPGDRRALSVSLTEKGLKQFLAQAAEHEKWIDGLMSGITKKQARHITKILNDNKR